MLEIPPHLNQCGELGHVWQQRVPQLRVPLVGEAAVPDQVAAPRRERAAAVRPALHRGALPGPALPRAAGRPPIPVAQRPRAAPDGVALRRAEAPPRGRRRHRCNKIRFGCPPAGSRRGGRAFRPARRREQGAEKEGGTPRRRPRARPRRRRAASLPQRGGRRARRRTVRGD
eukprot:gene6395-biopygen8780